MAGWYEAAELWMAGAGAWAYLAAPALMAAVAIVPVPAEAPAMINGMLFGAVLGSFLTWSGAMVGAWISFELARRYGRGLAERLLLPARLEQVDRLVEGMGWSGLLAARFVPVVAFTALNWGAGLTGVPRGRFLWTTALGILPGAILFTTSGVGLSRLYGWSPAVATGLVAVVAMLLLIWIWQRRSQGVVVREADGEPPASRPPVRRQVP